MSDARAAYRPTARALHWLTAAIVLATIPVGLVMTQEGLARPVQDALFIFHKNAGVAILLVVVLRLAFRAFNPPPPLPMSVPPLQRTVAKATHILLYVLLIVMAVSGYVRVVAGGFPLESLDAIGAPRLVPRSDALADNAKRLHFLTHYAVIALVAMHIAAALFHGLVKRDGVFSRMWPSVAR